MHVCPLPSAQLRTASRKALKALAALKVLAIRSAIDQLPHDLDSLEAEIGTTSGEALTRHVGRLKLQFAERALTLIETWGSLQTTEHQAPSMVHCNTTTTHPGASHGGGASHIHMVHCTWCTAQGAASHRAH